jgi:hypothetical protein
VKSARSLRAPRNMRPRHAVFLTRSIFTPLPRPFPPAPTLSGNISGTGSGAKRTFCPPPGFMMPRHSAEVFFFKRTRSVTHLESILIEVFILNNLILLRMNIYEKQGKRPLFAQFWCNVNPFRMNTCKSVSKQRTLTSFRMNTYEKHTEVGWVLWLTRIPTAQRWRFRAQPTLKGFGYGIPLSVHA